MPIVHITKDNYNQLVKQPGAKVLLDFWAPWCGPCKMIAPFLEEIAAEDESVVIGKINVDEEMALAMEFGITSIPTLILMENGEKKDMALGYRPKADILKFLNK